MNDKLQLLLSGTCHGTEHLFDIDDTDTSDFQKSVQYFRCFADDAVMNTHDIHTVIRNDDITITDQFHRSFGLTHAAFTCQHDTDSMNGHQYTAHRIFRCKLFIQERDQVCHAAVCFQMCPQNREV